MDTSGLDDHEGPGWPELEWLDDDPGAEPEHHWLTNPPTVAAILVAHNGARWLPKVLPSLGNMFFAPTAWRAVDVGSADGGSELLRGSFGAERISYAPSGTGFGEAVQLGLEHLPKTDWIWLLHDDATILPGTLAGLLDVATSSPDIAVVGPKVREWPSLKRLLEVGVSITNTGSRETGLETGEPDAGQHDWPRDVLAVSSAGMLVRRDVWDHLGGFDPALPMFFDDIDFGWRVARAGFRTRTAPSALLFHAEASWRGTRPRAAGDVPDWEVRRAGLYTVLANTSTRRFAWQYVRLLIGSLLRFVGFLISKDPESASDELLALRSVYGKPLALRAARRERAATAVRSPAEFRHLFPPFWLPYRHGFDLIVDGAVAMIRPESFEGTGQRSLGVSEERVEIGDARPNFAFRHPWLVGVVALFALAIVAGRGLINGPDGSVLHGGALPPAPGSAGDWWKLLFEGTHPVGLLSTDLAPIFVIPLALAATVVWPFPGLVISALMLFAVPLAGLAAHRLGRRLTPRRSFRIVWATSYALSVVAVGAVAQGRIGTVVALIVLPIIVNTALQLVENPNWQVGVRLGVWIAVAGAFSPVSLVLVGFGLIALLVFDRRWVLRAVVVSAVTTMVLLGPWLGQRFIHPLRVFWEAGYPLAGHASAWELIFGRAGGLGAAPIWFNVALPVLAGLAIIPRLTRGNVLLCWLIALAGLAVAVVGNALSFNTGIGPGHIPAWVGVPVVVWTAGLLTAVMFAAHEVAGLPQKMLAGLMVAALLLPVGVGLWWVIRGVDAPLEMAPPDLVPAYLAANPGSTLVVTGTAERGADIRVVEGTGPFLGQEALTPNPQRNDAIVRAVARLMAQPSQRDVAALSELGVSAIYAPHADGGIARRIDGAPGLRPAGSDSPDSRAWSLPGQPSKLQTTEAFWRWGIAGMELFVWLVGIVLTAPVHRRRSLPALDAEEADA